MDNNWTFFFAFVGLALNGIGIVFIASQVVLARRRPYIEERQIETGYEGLYAELKWLTEELQRLNLSGPPYVPLAMRHLDAS